MNEISALRPSKGTAAAVRKIVFETWSHQDYFGAVGDDSAAAVGADDNHEERRGGGGAQHSVTPRVFCDVSINRRIKGRDARDSALLCWKGRIRRWRWRRIGNNVDDDDDDISDKTDNNDGNDKDAENNSDNNKTNTNNNNEKSDGKHGALISYKPFILETTSTPRFYHPTYHINTWKWDDDNDQQTNLNLPFPTSHSFLRQLEVGDTIGIWGRVAKGETYHIIDAMRMHVFWAL